MKFILDFFDYDLTERAIQFYADDLDDIRKKAPMWMCTSELFSIRDENNNIIYTEENF